LSARLPGRNSGRLTGSTKHKQQNHLPGKLLENFLDDLALKLGGSQFTKTF
jgi:hypothetical protein